jgi:cytochrome c
VVASHRTVTHRRRPLLTSLLCAALVVSGCAGGPGPAPTPRATPVARAGDPADRTPLAPAPGVAGSPDNGRRLFVTTGCGGCHTLPSVPTATGVVGPNLTSVVLRPTLAGDAVEMSPDTLTRWLVDPATVKPGTSMPSVGLTEQEARDIAAFMYSQPHNPGR